MPRMRHIPLDESSRTSSPIAPSPPSSCPATPLKQWQYLAREYLRVRLLVCPIPLDFFTPPSRVGLAELAPRLLAVHWVATLGAHLGKRRNRPTPRMLSSSCCSFAGQTVVTESPFAVRQGSAASCAGRGSVSRVCEMSALSAFAARRRARYCGLPELAASAGVRLRDGASGEHAATFSTTGAIARAH